MTMRLPSPVRLGNYSSSPPPKNPVGERVACWVMANPAKISTRGVAVNNTWGRFCDYLVFMSTKHFAGMNTVSLPLGYAESRETLWRKSQLAWLYM